jgi:hypothetical protein
MIGLPCHALHESSLSETIMANEVLIKRLLGSSLLLVEIEWLLYRQLL